ncbi:capsid protein [Marmot associated feces virus 5]|uniref:Capsid protein n=1 Tax=Marmot associated feces virus 5 TaxID=2800900 RepID=A0A7T7IJJ2_9VIRU|nr:capsid protein [Marmot associated feces virus 5]
MPMFRKRTFATFTNGSRFGASNGTRAFKKRRFNRRRRSTKRSGGRRTTDYTSLNTRGHAVGFRSRKTSRGAYRRHIWNSTLFKDHYRSISTQATGFNTPASTTTSVVLFFNMYNHSTTGANPFWETSGGAQPIDEGENVPDFENVVLRGGKYEMTIANQSTNDIKVKLYRVTTGNNPDLTLNPSPLGSVDQQWDPSVEPDFYRNMGKPWMSREVLIEGGNAYTFVTRFKSQKIDERSYQLQSRAPYIFIQVGNVGSSVANAFEVKRGYNLSYSGDATTVAV